MTTSTYTTVYLQTNAASRERLAVGLLLVEEGAQRIRFAYSSRKLGLGRELIGRGQLRQVRWALDNIHQRVATWNEPTAAGQLAFPAALAQAPFTDRYLDYLHRYQQNLLQYGAPVGIDLPCTDANFAFLYQEQVDDAPEPSKISDERRRLLSVPEREIIRTRFNHNVRVDQHVDARIDIPVRVSLLGKNGEDYYGKIIDSYRPIQFIDNDTSSFYALTVQTQGSKHYVISQEPDKLLYPKQHRAWDTLRRVDKFSYLDVSEIGVLEEVAESNGVHKLFADEEE